MSVTKGFAGGFGGCFGVAAAMIVLFIVIPLSCVVCTSKHIADTVANMPPPTPPTPTPTEIQRAEKPVRQTRHNDPPQQDQIGKDKAIQLAMDIIRKCLDQPDSADFYSATTSDNVPIVPEAEHKRDGRWEVVGVVTAKGDDGSWIHHPFKIYFDSTFVCISVQINKLVIDNPASLKQLLNKSKGVEADSTNGNNSKTSAPRAEEDTAIKVETEQKGKQANEAKEKKEKEAARLEAIQNAKWHTWTTPDGNYTVEAKYITADSEIVFLEKRDGKKIQVPRSKISDDDLEWIKRKGWESP